MLSLTSAVRGEFGGEVEQVVAAGSGERVDGLCRVAYHADVAVVTEPSGEQPMLQGRDILVFVDGEPCDAGADAGRHVFVAFDEVAGDEQDVVEVDFVAIGFFGFVGFVRRPRIGLVPVLPAAGGGWPRRRVHSLPAR